MKTLFKLSMMLHVWIYRLSGGRMGGSMNGFKILLLTTRGRKSGKSHTTPLGHFDHPDGYLVVASNGGQPNHPGWYYNLKSNPRVRVQVLNQEFAVTAEELTGEARAEAWRQLIAGAPQYAGYEKRTKREIPLIVLHPEA